MTLLDDLNAYLGPDPDGIAALLRNLPQPRPGHPGPGLEAVEEDPPMPTLDDLLAGIADRGITHLEHDGGWA